MTRHAAFARRWFLKLGMSEEEVAQLLGPPVNGRPIMLPADKDTPVLWNYNNEPSPYCFCSTNESALSPSSDQRLWSIWAVPRTQLCDPRT